MASSKAVLLLFLTALTSAIPVAQPYNQASSYGGDGGVDTEAGASGTDNSSIQISKGAIIAIAVVVSLVVILGAISTILFFIAKKRQWQVRKSIKRASRRVTSKITGKPMRADPVRRSRRHGAVKLQGESSRDVEKGVRKGPEGRAIEMTKSKKAVAVMPPA